MLDYYGILTRRRRFFRIWRGIGGLFCFKYVVEFHALTDVKQALYADL